MASQIVSLVDIKTHLAFNNPNDSSPQDTVLQSFIDAATGWVEGRVGPVTNTGYVERHDGWGGVQIMLKHSPVLSVNYVKEYRSTGGLLVLAESTPANTLDGYQIEYPTGLITRVFQGGWPRTFFPGSRNIEVSYIVGYEPIPAEIQLATKELVTHWFRNTQQAPPPGGAGLGTYDATETQAGLWQAVPYRVIDLVDRFRKQAIG